MKNRDSLLLSNKKILINRIENEFKNQFNSKHKILTLTPGRINIIGEHTDYNNGLSMPAAIDRWICQANSKNKNKYFTIFSLNFNETIIVSPSKIEKFDEVWKRLIVSTIHIICKELHINEGANVIIGGNIPIGCGLSSSSALVISLVYSISRLFRIDIEGKDLAHLSQKIENKALGTAGGFLDQYGIILSKKNRFMIIDFEDNSLEYIPTVLKNCSWLLVNSNVPRELSDSAYNDRVKECQRGLSILKKYYKISNFRQVNKIMLKTLKKKSSILYKRLFHVISENERVFRMKKNLEKGDPDNVGLILSESHESLKSLYEVSCTEIDYIIKVSNKIENWYGGRIIGGGFGGCSIHLLSNQGINEYKNYISKKYKNKFNINPEFIELQFIQGISV